MKVLASAMAMWCLVTPLAAQNAQGPVTLSELIEAQEAEEDDAFAELIAVAEPLTRDLALWTYLRAGEGTFEDATAFLNARPDWPGLTRLRARAEEAITQDIPSADILAFFDGAEIETGEGAVAYADALFAAGRGDEAEAMLIAVWTTQGLTDEGHQAIVNAYPDIIAPYHAARTDMLLWRWRTTDAQNVLPLLDEGQQALVRARIGYITKDGDLDDLRRLVPERLRTEPGLAYDRFNWLAERTDWTDASELLLAQSTSAANLGIPWRWGSWRRILARWNMREGNIDRAYTMAANHFIGPLDNNYADLEWLAGYIALTYLRDFEQALIHFQNFDAVVETPISKGRAGYWLGRAHEGLGNAEAAVQAFQAGAMHQTSFYGLLSAEQLGLTIDPDLVGGEDFGDWRSGPVLQNELVRAGLALLDAGERGAAVLFIRDAAAGMTRLELGQLGQMLMEIDEPFYAVLAAKTAVREGLLVQDVYFPIHPMAEMDLPVEPALALAIARQESEFRVDAGSSVGALGLMQLMPGTASDVAGWLGLPYSRARLTTDWEYNATLGSEYLAYLTREFGDSPVMIAAGYNAGPGRPAQWMRDRGDPRRGMGNADPVDVVDWIEHIPFRETRNYVMRVTEGVPIYRARLTGQIGPVAFTDYLVGVVPVLRPVARPERTVEPTLPPVRRAGELEPQAPSGPQTIRPVARAGEGSGG